ncbi:MAG: aminotransferase class I/II-fold pyridoxal phosphate-dependent enzyme [Planctomycetota bacterium]
MPPFRPFLLERWFAAHEHAVRFQLGASDCEPLTLGELLGRCDVDPTALLAVRLGYTESNGDPTLRAAIAAHYDGCTARQVLVAGAPQEAIALTFQALLAPGDRVVVQTPCYQSLLEVPRQLGCDVVPWSLLHGQAFAFDLDALAELLRPPTRMVVTNAPHNPTGLHPDQDQWRRIAERIARSGAIWFSDEMYRGLAPDDARELPPAATLTPRAISLWGLSKSFGLPGLRLGWLVAQEPEWLQAIEAQKDFSSICSNAVAEFAATAALRCTDRFLRPNRARIQANAAAVAALADRCGDRVTWLPPQAGPVGLLRVRGEPASAVAERLLPDALAVPSRLFDLPDHWLRIGLGRRDLPDALPLLERALRAGPG